MYELIKKRLEEFDKQFTRDDGLIEKYYYDDDGLPEFAPVLIKRFIKSHSIQLLEKEIEWLKGMKKEYIEDAVWKRTEDWKQGFNDSLTDQISHLKAEIKKIKKL